VVFLPEDFNKSLMTLGTVISKLSKGVENLEDVELPFIDLQIMAF
jgi:hypothetical protein